MNELGPRGPRDFLLTPGTTPQASALSAASEEPEDTASTEGRGERQAAGQLSSHTAQPVPSLPSTTWTQLCDDNRGALVGPSSASSINGQFWDNNRLEIMPFLECLRSTQKLHCQN